MAQVTQTSTRFYAGITDVESSGVLNVSKNVNIQEILILHIQLYILTIFRKRLEKKSSKEPHARTHRIVVFIGLALMMPKCGEIFSAVRIILI